MSEIKVNKISPRAAYGTTTLGDSGDTFTIPAGVTITNSGTAAGFGSTGEVSWNTTKITADPGPAVSGVGYFTDTSGAAFNVTLPSSPSAGAVIAVADYSNTWDTKNLTILRNGSNIEGAAENFICNTEGAAITFVYVDATKGWVVTNTGNSTGAQNANYVAATGGNTVTTCGNFKIHTFTGPGTFTVTCAGNSLGSNTVDYLVVAGGGGGGHWASGGGGGGGFRESPGTASGCYSVSPRGAAPAVALPVSVQGYPIGVGGGGAKGTGPGAGNGVNGINSTFSTITSAGGGFGGGYNVAGSNGGSGGGGVTLQKQEEQEIHLQLIQHKEWMVEQEMLVETLEQVQELVEQLKQEYQVHQVQQEEVVQERQLPYQDRLQLTLVAEVVEPMVLE